MSNDILLDKLEICAITRKAQPAAQLKVLHKRGFYRAFRVDDSGPVILERAHYEAVCTGGKITPQKPAPKVRKIRNEEKATV